MNDRSHLECREHGEAHATYVCRHLIEGTNTNWYSAEPDEENPWPDSWCGICNQFFEAEGEWNEKSEQAADIGANLKLLCHHCYTGYRSKCTTHTV